MRKKILAKKIKEVYSLSDIEGASAQYAKIISDACGLDFEKDLGIHYFTLNDIIEAFSAGADWIEKEYTKKALDTINQTKS